MYSKIDIDINYKKIIICFSPVIPHFASECLEDFKLHKNIKWPDFDKSALEEEKINFVIGFGLIFITMGIWLIEKR